MFLNGSEYLKAQLVFRYERSDLLQYNVGLHNLYLATSSLNENMVSTNTFPLIGLHGTFRKGYKYEVSTQNFGGWYQTSQTCMQKIQLTHTTDRTGMKNNYVSQGWYSELAYPLSLLLTAPLLLPAGFFGGGWECGASSSSSDAWSSRDRALVTDSHISTEWGLSTSYKCA